MIVLGTCTTLRISDLLNLRWDDVFDFHRNKYRFHIELTEMKTGKKKRIPIPPRYYQRIESLLSSSAGNYIFNNGRSAEKSIGRVQAWRIIHNAAKEIGIDGNIACHSLRKTSGYFAWKYQKTPFALLMEIYNHSAETITKHYLGITQDDIDQVYRNNNFHFSSAICENMKQNRLIATKT